MRMILALFLSSVVTTGAFGQTVFSVSIDGSQANAGGGTGSLFTGSGTVTLNGAENQIDVALTHNIPNVDVIAGHIHVGAVGVGGGVVFAFVDGMSPVNETFAITPAEVLVLKADGHYVNIHTNAFPAGEIRGQILAPGVVAPLKVWLTIIVVGSALVVLGASYLRRGTA